MNNNAITGGAFVVKDEKGNTVSEGKTTENGIFTVKGLTPGKYTVKQTKAPDGYEVNNEEYTFIVTNDGKMVDANSNAETKIIIKNNKKQTVGNVQINNDTTVANKTIPNAGIKTIIAFIAIVALVVVIFFVRYSKYKSIK